MPPLSVMIKPVSGACNMHCQYCFYADEMRSRETAVYPRMTESMLETIVRRCLAYSDNVTFVFQGGEPTLIGLPFYEALVLHEKKYRKPNQQIHHAVQTNGYDLPDEMIRFFAEEHFLLGISLDGTQEIHDNLRRDGAGKATYARVQDTMRRLQAAGVDFNVLCVVSAEVAKHAGEVFDALAPYGYLQFIPCLDELDGKTSQYSLTEELYLSFLKTTFDRYYTSIMRGKPVSVRTFDNDIGILLGMMPESCAMIGHCTAQLLIEGDGSVFPCDFYALDKWKLGNITTDPIRKMMKSERMMQFIHESCPVPMQCRQCRWYPLCRNGCRRERNADGVSRWCRCNQEFFAYSYDKMKAIAEKIMRDEQTGHSTKTK